MTRTAVCSALAALLALTHVPWPAGIQSLLAQAQDRPVQSLDVARLRAWQQRLARVARVLPARVSLAELVGTLMQGGPEKTSDGEPIEENRTALVAIAFYVNGWPLAALAPEARQWPNAERREVTLRGRQDLAQHFTVSALIVAYAGTPLANLAGLYKELKDARGDSGFSFSDLAADRAGTTFGDAATRSVESARRLQARLTPRLGEDDVMPGIDGLPDNLSQAEFTRRYGGVGAPAYNQLMEDIDRRVAALALFQTN